MSTSAVTICNWALGHIGADKLIASLNENSKSAITCNLYYEAARDQVLRDYAFPFATAWQTLGLVEEDPNDDWSFSYQLPTSCLRALTVTESGDTSRNTTTTNPFRLAVGASGTLILTDVEDAVLAYTQRIEDTTTYPIDVAMAVSWQLATLIAMPMGASEAIRAEVTNGYTAAMSKAKRTAGNEQQRDPRAVTEFEQAYL